MNNPSTSIVVMNKTKSLSKRPKLVFLIGLTIVFALVLVLLFLIDFRLTISQEDINIRDMYVTSSLSSNGQPQSRTINFSNEIARIYCVIIIESQNPVNMGIRWFHDDKVIFEDREVVEKSRIFYIQPPPGEKFLPGEYQVEIYLVKEPVRTLNFTINNN